MYDYHSHTSFSADCMTPMKEMVEAACKKGIQELAITDHYDPDYPIPSDIDLPGYHKALNQAKETYKDKIKIIKGLEIGILKGSTLEKCRTTAHSFDYDFIIGSFHSADGYEIHEDGYFANRSLEDSYVAFYTFMRDCLKEFKDYDVLGHFNYIDRYVSRIPASSVYMDLAEEILKLIIADGKGIEINTSSFRHGMGERTTPAKEILHLFRQLGGEIITIGSDAHKPVDFGDHIGTAVEMMKSAGLKYLATYDQRKVNFVNLNKI